MTEIKPNAHCGQYQLEFGFQKIPKIAEKNG